MGSVPFNIHEPPFKHGFNPQVPAVIVAKEVISGKYNYFNILNEEDGDRLKKDSKVLYTAIIAIWIDYLGK